jgi:protein phosphatase
MNFLRKILGGPDQDSGRSQSSRRSSHVTPAKSKGLAAPIREGPPTPPAPEEPPEEEIAAPVAEPVDLAAAAPLEVEEAVTPATPEVDTEDPPLESETLLQHEPVVEKEPAPRRVMPPAPKPILTRQRQALTYGIASDVGLMRNNNEDACFGMQWHSITVDNRPDFGLFAVADGMGGHLDGERAAGIAVQTLASEMLDKIYVPLLRNFDAGNSPTVLEALVSASEKANQAVIKRVPGGGTTLSAIAVIGNLAYLVHVGDSRAYLIHDNKIEQLTTDHTLVQRLIEMKELTPDEAENYPQKNVLYRAIGQNEELKMERLVRTLPPSGLVLICTDGLWDMIEDDTIKQVALLAASPQEACDSLVKAANDRGGVDNISAIVFQAPGGGSSD